MKKSFKNKVLVFGGLLLCSTGLLSFTTAEIQRRELAQAMNFAFGAGNNKVWKNEKNPMQRDVLDEPLVLNQGLRSKEQSLSLFFTRAGSLNYSLGDMIDLNVIQKIMTNALEMKFALEVDSINEPDDADLDAQDARAAAVASQIASCAKQITFQEHRIGGVLYKKWQYNDFFIAARTWLGLAERNYWLDEQYRNRLTGLMAQLLPQSDGVFTLSDYVTMNWGMGDTQVTSGWKASVGKVGKMSIGVKGILPTAHQPRRVTAFKLIPLRLDDFGSFARARVNEAFISPNLGNRGHYGVGMWGESSWTKSFFEDKHQIKLKAYASADYLLPATEERLLMRYVDSSVTAQRGTFRTTNDHLFRAFIGQFVLPEPVDVVVAPGAILRLGLVGRYRAGHFDLSGGYDWYCKNKETITRCLDSDDAKVYILEQEPAGSNSIQHKVFGGVSYSAQHQNVSLGGFTFSKLALSIGLNAAVSLGASGMGKDFGFGLSVGCKC